MTEKWKNKRQKCEDRPGGVGLLSLPGTDGRFLIIFAATG